MIASSNALAVVVTTTYQLPTTTIGDALGSALLITLITVVSAV
ncbi:TPA: hypothetical protein ACTZ3T_001625 [Bacillus cereus]